nr:ERI1 exoribonuclease 2 isoform X3 [Paramormyrops kingsleyae]
MATKRLAKELGLIRKSRRAMHGSVNAQIGDIGQLFSYLIVIDFESTCWQERKNYAQEIIEFPAVLLNTSNGKTEAEFHTYVQPQEHPTLSEFCTELTGIRQTQVEAGVPLQVCLSQFARWLQTLQQGKNLAFLKHNIPAPALNPCAFVTWSDWDLGVCLEYECKRKQIFKPEMLNRWIDLRATYKVFYNRKPKGLNGALQDLGIVFSGREHSGLDDARNTAHLAWRMITDGCVLKLTKTLDRVSGFLTGPGSAVHHPSPTRHR